MDGVSDLRKRHNTRLWYRRWPADAPEAQPTLDHEEAFWAELFAAAAPEAPATPAASTEPPGPSAVTAPLAASHPMSPRDDHPRPRLEAPPKRDAGQTNLQSALSGDWRTVPSPSPSLLLSATELLDARIPGPVLRPGARYRVASVQNGVVGLEVVDPLAHVGVSLGYCAAVDLICIDPRFANQTLGRQFGAPTNPLKATVQRLTGGFTLATSFLGAASSHGSRLF
jgi:hypothetical protein